MVLVDEIRSPGRGRRAVGVTSLSDDMSRVLIFPRETELVSQR